MVAVSVNEYVGDTSLAGYYEVSSFSFSFSPSGILFFHLRGGPGRRAPRVPVVEIVAASVRRRIGSEPRDMSHPPPMRRSRLLDRRLHGM